MFSSGDFFCSFLLMSVKCSTYFTIMIFSYFYLLSSYVLSVSVCRIMFFSASVWWVRVSFYASVCRVLMSVYTSVLFVDILCLFMLLLVEFFCLFILLFVSIIVQFCCCLYNVLPHRCVCWVLVSVYASVCTIFSGLKLRLNYVSSSHWLLWL